jgi:hypothetical protein
MKARFEENVEVMFWVGVCGSGSILLFGFDFADCGVGFCGWSGILRSGLGFAVRVGFCGFWLWILLLCLVGNSLA